MTNIVHLSLPEPADKPRLSEFDIALRRMSHLRVRVVPPASTRERPWCQASAPALDVRLLAVHIHDATNKSALS
jgi:hypothetical protein